MAGLTMVELLIVIVIVAILVSIASTSYKSITTTARISSEINGLLGDMQYARSEAIKQGQNVVVCVSADAIDCTANATTWNSGWIVFVDPTNIHKTNGDATLVLRKQAAFTGTDTFTDGVTSILSYDREGLALGFAGTVIPLHEATSKPTSTRCLQITAIGGTSVQQPSTLATCT